MGSSPFLHLFDLGTHEWIISRREYSMCGMTLFLVNKGTISSSSFMSSPFVHRRSGASESTRIMPRLSIDNIQLPWVQETSSVCV